MIKPARINVEKAYQKIKSKEALLVCGYNDEEKFKAMQLEGAISFKEFESILPELSKDQEIIFYCAWPQEATSAGQAAKYIKLGYENTKALAGGVEAWRKAGYPMR